MTKFGKSLLATVAMLSLVATSAEAQGKWSLGIGGGSTLALGDAADAGLNNGPHGIVTIQYTIASGLGFQVDGMFHRIYADADTVLTSIVEGAQVFNGTANLLYKFQSAGKLSPYVLGGVGFYSSDAFGENTDVLEVSSTDFGWNAGAGFDYNVNSKLAVFFEARFHQILTSDDDDPTSINTSVLPLSLGVRFGF